MYDAFLVPILPGYPYTPVMVLGDILGTDKVQIRIIESGAYCSVHKDRIVEEDPT